MKMNIQRLILLTFFAVVFAAPALFAADVRVQKTATGWALLVDGQPYVVRGVTYGPTQVGEEPSQGNWRDWMREDDDGNGKIDATNEAWVDKNGNHRRDRSEAMVGDFKLMQEMGVNTVRIYHHPTTDPDVQAVHARVQANVVRYNHPPNKELLNQLFQTYGIRIAMGDLLGAYTVASGADWDAGTDYRDPEQKANMMKSVEAMVKDFKDEPYILFWVLGNENNYRPQTHTNAGSFQKEYAEFINEVAKRIHELDPHHPVAFSNGETHGLRTYAKYAPDVDIFGVNCYRRPGFGTLWQEVATDYNKPVVLTEFGILKPRLVQGEVDQDYQAKEHRAAWCDIQHHTDGQQAPGNAIGGFAFEWVDQWWYDGQPSDHNAGQNGYNNEYHGLTSQGDGSDSPKQRELRKAYFTYQQLWKTAEQKCE